jgi:hypothetical protein
MLAMLFFRLAYMVDLSTHLEMRVRGQ